MTNERCPTCRQYPPPAPTAFDVLMTIKMALRSQTNWPELHATGNQSSSADNFRGAFESDGHSYAVSVARKKI